MSTLVLDESIVEQQYVGCLNRDYEGKENANYDIDNYADTYWQHISEAELSVVFSSPCLNTQKLNCIIFELSKQQELGLKVTIVTWHPTAYKYSRDVRMVIF